MFKKLKAHIVVFLAFCTNNKNGKRIDALGRPYKAVYEKYGHKNMYKEYLATNSWMVK
jgi:hypothetical protein